ncbi:hypothetical protein KI688_011237 [Linnemannia hyalina]|uniref:Uncharacterized protein n=1 Tax=Linnemannia hyalina TaxID=64524 RepID=A0A9P7XUL2_9FUNG|nr:hypothetical protein KI688_011237 [Linnemannia hyalina]
MVLHDLKYSKGGAIYALRYIHLSKPIWFKDLEAEDLILGSVSIPITKDNEDTPILLEDVPPSDKYRLGPATHLSKAFPEELPEETVHIIVQRPPPVPVPVPVRVSTAPSDIIRSGSPANGKTRYGRELYRALRLRLSEKTKANDVDYAPRFYYMLLDFSKDVKLNRTNASLDTGTILALRLAYYHFFQGKYFTLFEDFRHQAVEHINFFTVSNVILAICKDLELNEQRPLFLFLHIDEFQLIFDHRWKGTPNGHRASLPQAGIRLPGDKTECHTPQGLCLFQDMMRTLGDFMSGTFRPHMIQTFLSGNARREVTMAAQPTPYTFEFLSCPTLSLGTCYDTMSHFTTLANVHHCEWMPKMAFLYLLSATDGLPRALELLLEELFGYRLEKCKTFPDALPHIDMSTDQIFRNVANNLNNYYSITAFAQAYEELVPALVHLNIFQQPSLRTLAPSKLFPELTLDVLERDIHTVLEEIDEGKELVLVRIPFFFLHFYNIAIGEVRNRLGSALLYNWVADREWRFFEGMIAEYEALRTNLLRRPFTSKL